MKKIITRFLFQKRNSLWDYFNSFYLVFVAIFGIIALYECVMFLIENYTFPRAIYVFIGLTIIYIFGLFKSFAGVKGTKASSIDYTSTSEKIYKWIRTLQKKLQPHVKMMTENKQEILQGGFLVFFVIFLYSFVFESGNLFQYSLYAFLLLFIGYKILGGSLDRNIQKQAFSERTFLKVLILSLSIFIICVSVILRNYGIEDTNNIILLISSLFYITGFTYIFSNIFTNIGKYFHGRKFRNLLIHNTYNLLSLFFISLALLLLLGKLGFFSSIGDRVTSYLEVFEPIDEIVLAPVPVTQPEKIPQENIGSGPVFVEKVISEIFTFGEFLEPGSTGPDVIKLQEALSMIGSFTGEISGNYGDLTKDALTQTLIEKCDWPETTRGVFGPLAQECINSITVQFEVNGQEAETSIISDEADIRISTISDEAVVDENNF